MMRKGQGAMEFMMTYGWAIFAVVIAIAALGYFGVLNPGRFMSDRCFVGVPFACGEYTANSTDVFLTVKNNAEDLTYVRIDLQGCGPVENDTLIATSQPAGGNISCALPANSNYKGKFNVTYTVLGGVINKTVEGELAVKVR